MSLTGLTKKWTPKKFACIKNHNDHVIQNVATFKKCQLKCEVTPNCNSVDYNKKTLRCHLSKETEWTRKIWSDKNCATCRAISAIEILKFWQLLIVFWQYFCTSLKTFYQLSDNTFHNQISLLVNYQSFVLTVIYKGVFLLDGLS